MKGILGRKAGMTQVFTKDGILVPVTVIEVNKNVVTQVKTTDVDGYNSLQLALGDKKEQNTAKGSLGHFKKANTAPKRFVREIRDMNGFTLGQEVAGSDVFAAGEFVDVTGISKGKGFAGPIKRHNQAIGPKGHGSGAHRIIGSMGDIESNKIAKGKKMPGHLGHEQKTIQNLEVIAIDDVNGVILVKGSVPGPNKSYVIVKNAVKMNGKTTAPVTLLDLNEAEVKNNLIEEATKYAAEVNTNMSVAEMRSIIDAAIEARAAEAAAAEAAEEAARLAAEAAANEAEATETNETPAEDAAN